MKWLLIIGGPLVLVVGLAFLTGIVSFSDASGLELEEQPVEYRDGTESTHVRKLDGVKKFGNITIKWPIHLSDFDLIFWHWTVETTNVQVETQGEGGVMMKQVEPPTLTLPAAPAQ